MNRTLKIFLACAFGTGIGAIIALQFGIYFWWLGPIIGGLVSYLSYEFKTVILAIPVAWKKTISVFRKPVPEGIKALFWYLIFFSSLTTNCLILQFLNPRISMAPCIFLYALCACIFFCAGVMIGSKEMSQLSKRQKVFLLSCSPIFFFTFWPLASLFITAKFLIKTFPIIARFSKIIFWQIHSEERLLCLVDAALGAGIGYFYHNALIGALSGGILGVINYEIVSKRLLKLVPGKN